MSEEHAIIITSWKYPEPYDLYNWQSWPQMVRNQYELAHPGIREAQYRSVLHPEDGLSGFAQLFPMMGVTRLGLGLRPDLCNLGLGVPFVQSIAAEAKRLKPAHEIDLEVLIWNHRALHVYQKAGFEITDEYEKLTPIGVSSFYCLVYRPDSD
jgi:RimJ/RimL family protein N-acetyltransferase